MGASQHENIYAVAPWENSSIFNDKLLISWEERDCWDKLCSFLGKTVPEIPLPHLMKSQTN